MGRTNFWIELVGYKRVTEKLKEMSPKAYVAVDKVLGEWAVTLWAYLRVNHPWKSRTGRLVRSHYYRKNSGDVKTMEPIEWEVGADTRRKGTVKNYAMFLEFGWTHYKTGQFLMFPWFRPAFERFKGAIIKQVKESIKREVAVKGEWTGGA